MPDESTILTEVYIAVAASPTVGVPDQQRLVS